MPWWCTVPFCHVVPDVGPSTAQPLFPGGKLAVLSMEPSGELGPLEAGTQGSTVDGIFLGHDPGAAGRLLNQKRAAHLERDALAATSLVDGWQDRKVFWCDWRSQKHDKRKSAAAEHCVSLCQRPPCNGGPARGRHHSTRNSEGETQCREDWKTVFLSSSFCSLHLFTTHPSSLD